MPFFQDCVASVVLKPSCIRLYIPVLDFGFLRRSTSCVHAVVRAPLSRTIKKNVYFMQLRGLRLNDGSGCERNNLGALNFFFLVTLFFVGPGLFYLFCSFTG